MTPEEYAKAHKQAFRVAFDFLNAHFPPGPEPEWWEQTARDASAASGDNELTLRLLIGVLDYLDYEWKRRNLHGKPADG